MAIQSIEILKGYMTCEDPAVRNKYYNLLDSFWHKTQGDLLLKITETSTYIQLDFTSGKTVKIPKMPESVDISFVNGLQTALNDKVDKVLGKGLSTNDFTNELLQKLNGLENYVHPEQHQISEVDGLQSALGDKVDKEAGKSLTSNDFTNALKAAVESYQKTLVEEIITESGSHHDINKSCGYLRFKNTDAQAVITGFKAPAGSKTLEVVADGEYSLRLEAENENSLALNRLKLPGNLDAIEITPGGKMRWRYSPSLERWEINNEWGSGLMPSLIDTDATENAGVGVTPSGKLLRLPLRELTKFDDVRTTKYQYSTEVNTEHPNRNKGEMVFVTQVGQLVFKKDNAPGNWAEIPMNALTFEP